MVAAVYSMSKFVSIYVALISGICYFSLPFDQLYSCKNTYFIWLLTGLMAKLIIDLEKLAC